MGAAGPERAATMPAIVPTIAKPAVLRYPLRKIRQAYQCATYRFLVGLGVAWASALLLTKLDIRALNSLDSRFLKKRIKRSQEDRARI